MEEVLISIVMPVYNVSAYIDRSINSVLTQVYNHFELILVDDGSTDDSGKICDKYAENDDRIKVIHKENGGLSSARNAGINVAVGKYITFIDSDDYISRYYLEYLYKGIIENNVDISICSCNVVTDKGKSIYCGNETIQGKMTKVEAIENMLLENGFSVSSCAKLYSRKLFNDVEYPIGKVNEDNGTTYKLIDKVKEVYYGSESHYFYYMRTGSIMNSKFTIKKLDMIELTDEMCEYLDNNYAELRDVTFRRRVYARFNVLRQLMENYDCKYEGIKKDIILWLKSNKSEILNGKKVQKKDKIAMICLMVNEKFFRFAWSIYSKARYL